MTRHFATSCDANYSARALVMIESLLRWSPGAEITVLCLDDQVGRVIEGEFPSRVSTVTTATLSDREPRLLEVRGPRTPWEFYATQKPFLLRWKLERIPDGELLAFVDADTYFFSDPEPIFSEAQAASVAVSPHRFNEATAHLAIHGPYNAGFGLWRNDAIGTRCLLDWCAACLEWCYCRVEGGRFMNQGFLADWPAKYERTLVLKHPGQNLAPWNIGTHRLDRQDAALFVDGFPLIFFHFSAVFRGPNGQLWTFKMCDALQQPLVLRNIYRPYLVALEQAGRRLAAKFGLDGIGSVRDIDPNIPVLDLATAQQEDGK